MAKLAVLEERLKHLADAIAASNVARNDALARLEKDLRDDIEELAEKQRWQVRLIWFVVIAFASIPFWQLLELVRVVK